MKGVNVEIMGQALTVASDGGDNYVQDLAHAVDAKIKEIRGGGTQAVSSIHLAILAALNFADELERLRLEHQALVERIEAMNKRLSAAIDGTQA
ncbi:MAG: cell division protein ZapA [Candidatus Binataceae bacterium]|jgi:cell division protein ZapA